MSTQIDRNQTIVSHLKNISSGKSENDFTPQKQTAFKQLQALTSTMEDRSGSLNDDMEQLKELLQNFGGSKTENKLIASLSKKIDEQLAEMTKLADAIQGSSTLDGSATVGEGDSEGDESSSDGTVNPSSLTPTPTTTSTETHISITSGSQVIAAQILLELQQKYAELQQILQTILQDNLSHSTGIVKALSDAAKDSLVQEAKNQEAEASAYTMQAVTSGTSIVSTGVMGVTQHKQSKPIENQMNNIQQHEALLERPSSNAILTNRRPNLGPSTERYIQRLKQNDFSMRAGDDAVRTNAYKKMTPGERETVAKNLNEKGTQHSNSLQSIQTRFTKYEGVVNNLTQIATNAKQAATKGTEADNDRLKGADAAQQSISQNSTENANSAISQNRENISQAQQQSGQVLKVRESIIQSNTAVGH